MVTVWLSDDEWTLLHGRTYVVKAALCNNEVPTYVPFTTPSVGLEVELSKDEVSALIWRAKDTDADWPLYLRSVVVSGLFHHLAQLRIGEKMNDVLKNYKDVEVLA